jgi:hypothetical protein
MMRTFAEPTRAWHLRVHTRVKGASRSACPSDLSRQRSSTFGSGHESGHGAGRLC